MKNKSCPLCNSYIPIKRIAVALRSDSALTCPKCDYQLIKDMGLFNGLSLGIMFTLIAPIMFFFWFGGGKRQEYIILIAVLDVEHEQARLIALSSLFLVPITFYLIWRTMSYIVALMINTNKR